MKSTTVNTAHRPWLFPLLLSLIIAAGIGAAGFSSAYTAESLGGESVAVGIVFDTSGSMRDPVNDAQGNRVAKHVIARRALLDVVKRLESFATAGGPAPRSVEAGLVVFQNGRPHEAIRFGKFDPDEFERWAEEFDRPDGATPLGNSIDRATKRVLASNPSRKHVLIVTDGVNTAGPKPEFLIPKLQKQAQDAEQIVGFHFVAFDIGAKVFKPVRDLGATVVEAADEVELGAQLNYIVERKILLEDEE